MAHTDILYKELCTEINTEGRLYENRNRRVKRLQITSHTVRHNFKDGFPALTAKQLPYKFVKGELIWFLRGDTNIKYLLDNGIPIWNKDAYNLYVKVTSANLASDANHMYRKNLNNTLSMFTMDEFINIISSQPMTVLKEAFSYERYTMGDVGRNYSAQWRSYRGKAIAYNSDDESFIYERHDQIKKIIEDMRNDIMSTRLKVASWNPSELDETALPPCHDNFQVIGVPLSDREMIALARENGANISKNMRYEELVKMGIPEFGFELHWGQRSTDTFLGLPFNLASYATLAKVFEEITEIPALGVEGNLKCAHFYDNQFEGVETLLSRDSTVHGNCTLAISAEFKALCQMFRDEKISLDELFNLMDINMFKLIGYTSDEAINVEMLAPIKI
jgi:thymidylate synthase